ncbi:LysR family transcriptional regulator [Paracoccus methylarcula]|uniref:LysR family transcriptional regulator n=1 Tax=Paracoccus methylarcula TaxID=72022 RepID=A0A422QWI3_9RHOB|nr:LysR family transcriptional regulator [Paracoccus methylarcula]RNF34325.1 LysR family transcriptional regulator [Paracoccus methylarcula]
MRNRIDMKTLQAFITVAREGNVSRAADILCLTQPAVSLQLRKLAQDTGLELSQRTPKGLDLTADGKVLMVKAEQVLGALAEFGQTAQRLTHVVGGQLRVGTVVDPSFIRLGTFLSELVEAAPELRTQLVHGMSGEILLKILREELDIGYFLGTLDDIAIVAGSGAVEKKGGVAYRELTRFRYRILAPARWESRVHGLGWAELARLPWIGTPRESVHHRLLLRVLEPLGIRQNCVTLADQEMSMLALVRSGVGLCLSRESIALHEQQAHGLVIVEDHELEASLAFISLQRRSAETQVELARRIMMRVWNIDA